MSVIARLLTRAPCSIYYDLALAMISLIFSYFFSSALFFITMFLMDSVLFRRQCPNKKSTQDQGGLFIPQGLDTIMIQKKNLINTLIVVANVVFQYLFKHSGVCKAVTISLLSLASHFADFNFSTLLLKEDWLFKKTMMNYDNWSPPKNQVKPVTGKQSSLQKINFSIIIEGPEWTKISPSLKNDKDRSTLRLNGSWMRIINDKIFQSQRLPCAFSAKRQKFPASGQPYFTIEGYCINCKQELHGICNNLSSNGVVINITCLNTFGTIHQKCNIQVKGDYRVELGDRMLTTGVALEINHEADKILNDSGGNAPTLSSANVLHKVLQEAQNRLIGVENSSTDVISAIISDMDNDESIRKISTIPFYINFWTENQITLWKEISGQDNSFISIDASGSFVRRPKIYKNKKSQSIFLYVIVSSVDKKICPLAQFLSSKHDTNNILMWLIEWLSSGAPIPKVCILDGAGALLNATSLAFNSKYFLDYMELCFEILTGKKSVESLPNCCIKRDRAHLLKNIAQLKYFQGENWVKKDFYMRVIGYLLKVSKLKLFVDVITSLFIICHSDYCNEDSESCRRVKWLMDKIGTFDYEEFYDIEDMSAEENGECEFLEYEALNLEVPSTSLIKSFILDIKEKSLSMCSKGVGDTGNAYYLPDISDYLVTLFSHCIAWTNLMNPFFKLDLEVSTSTRSECFFKILRTNYKNNNIKSCYKFIKKFLCDTRGGIKLCRGELKNVQPSERIPSCNNEKVFYPKNCNLIEKPNVLGELKNVQPFEIIPSCSNEKDFYPKNCKLKEEPKVPEKSCLDTYITMLSPLARHYLNFVGEKYDYTVTVYNCTDISDDIFSYKNYKNNLILRGSEYKTLFCGNLYIDHSIVDAFMIVHVKENWPGVSFVPAAHTNYILGNSAYTEKGTSWLMFNVEHVFSGKLFLPFCLQHHWMMLYLNIDAGTMIFFDPQNVVSSKPTIKAFNNYLDECKLLGINNNLCQIKWTEVPAPRQRPIQFDGCNCGLYILKYMDLIAKNENLNVNFDPYYYRVEVAEMLFNKSNNVSDICLICGNYTRNDFNECCRCKRWSHKKCLRNLQSHRKNSDEINNNKYTCHVCEPYKYVN